MASQQGVVGVLAGLTLSQQVVLWGLGLAFVAVLARRGWLKLFGPVLFYDLVRTARRTRYILIRTIYAVAIVLVLAWVYLAWILEEPGHTIPAREMATFAESFFSTFVSIMFVAVFVLTPAYVAGAIAEEKELKTLEYLLATDLRNREIVLSKLASRTANLTLLILAGLPVLSFMQFLGGVDPNLVLVAFAATALTMLSLAGLSILNSVFAKKARDAIVLTYLGAVAYLALSILGQVLVGVSAGVAGFPSTETWTSPVTVQDLATWFSTGNVFIQMFELVQVVSSGANIEDRLPGILRDYAIFHGSIALACSTWAVLRLRPVALKQTYGKAEKMSLARRLWGRPRPGPRPMLWKEIVAEPGLRFNWMGRIAIAILVLVSFVPAVWIIIYFFLEADRQGWSTSGRWWDGLGEAINIWVRTAGTGVASLTLLAVAVRAAGSITWEREKQTFDSLLTSPLDSDDILFGKWAGSILSVRWGWLWLALIWGIGLVTGGVFPLAVPLLVGAWLVYAAFLSGLGLWFSAVSRTTLRANIYTLLSTVAICFSHWLVWMCCIPIMIFFDSSRAMGRDFEEVLKFQTFGLTPPFTLGFLAFNGEEFKTHTYNLRNEGIELLACSLIGVFLYAVAAGVLWAVTSSRFRTLIGRERRLPQLDPNVRPEISPTRPSRLSVPPIRAQGAILISEEWDDRRGPRPEAAPEVLDVLPAEDKSADNAGEANGPARP